MIHPHSSGNLNFYLCLGVGFGLYCFIKGFRVYREYRVVEDTPETPIRSVAMGLARVHGKAVGDERVTSPVTHTPCYFYKVDIERWKSDQDGGNWSHYRTDTNGVKFYLEDASGRCLVDARDAEFDLPKLLTREVGRHGAMAAASAATDAELLSYVNTVTATKITSFVARRLEGAGPLGDPAKEQMRQAALEIFKQPFGSQGFLSKLAAMQMPAVARRVEKMGVQSDPVKEGQRLDALEALRHPFGSPEFVEHFRRVAAAEGHPDAEQHFTSLIASFQGAQPGGFAGGLMPPASGRFRFTEYCVVPGQEYDVTGTCVENPAAKDVHDRNLILKGQNEPTFLISAGTQQQTERHLGHRAVAMVFGGGALAIVCLGILLGRLGLF